MRSSLDFHSFVVAIGLVFLALTGCDGGPGGTGGDTGSPSEDTGRDGATDTDTGTEDAVDTVADTSRDSGGDGDTTDTGPTCVECENCVACEYQQGRERSCQLQGENRPPRCDMNPTEVDEWGSGGVMTSLEFASKEARDCCFNIDGSADGSVDNKVGKLVDGLPIDADKQVKYGLLYEDFAGLAEFNGLTSLDQTESFEANVYLGRFASQKATQYVQKADADCDLSESDCELKSHGGRAFAISPETLDKGAHAQGHFPEATIQDGTIEAGPGRITLNVTLEDIGSFQFDIRGATIEAEVDRDATDLQGDGVVISKGEIGGYVLMEDIVGQINSFLAPCNCLGNPDAAVTYPNADKPDDPDLLPRGCKNGTLPEDECEVKCTEAVQQRVDSCGEGSTLICKQSSSLCPAVSLLKSLPDLDTDGDGQKDAISAGALFGTKGARITGIADYVRGSNQTVSSQSRVVLEEMFANKPGWIAVYENRSYDQNSLLGHRKIEAGHQHDLDLELTEQPTEKTRVWAVLHRDDGETSGTFEIDEDSKVKRFPEMDDYVQSRFWLTPSE